MAEINEYELQALWCKRVLSAFTKRHDRQEIPYVLELLRCVGDQRATETREPGLVVDPPRPRRRHRRDPHPCGARRGTRRTVTSAQCSPLTSARYLRSAGSLQADQAGDGSPCDTSRYARRSVSLLSNILFATLNCRVEQLEQHSDAL